jgi:hypothetical protein
MDAQEFETIFEAQVDACRKTLVKKAEEYSPVDRLSNFKVAGTLAGCTPQQALGGMLAKHIVSIYDLIRDDSSNLDIWNEKLGDALNYLFLLKALLIEQNNPPITKQGASRADETVTFLKKINTEANYTYPNKK